MSWAGLGNVLISKELNSLRLHVLILSNSFEIKTLPRPAQDCVVREGYNLCEAENWVQIKEIVLIQFHWSKW
jgi:hypothetical protein